MHRQRDRATQTQEGTERQTDKRTENGRERNRQRYMKWDKEIQIQILRDKE